MDRPRPAMTRRLLSLLGILPTCGLVPAQALRVVDHHGKPLAGARVTQLSSTRPQLLALADQALLQGPSTARRLSPSGRRGGLRIPPGTTGLLWIEQGPKGRPALGCLHAIEARPQPGIKDLICRPLARLEVPVGLQVALQWQTPKGLRVSLGKLAPGSHLLPADNYLGLIHRPGQAEVQRLVLAPGQQRRLTPRPSSGQLIQVPTGLTGLQLPSWPATPLSTLADKLRVPSTTGHLLYRPVHSDGNLLLRLNINHGQLTRPVATTDIKVRVRDPRGLGLAGAEVVSVFRDDWGVQASFQAHTDSKGQASARWPQGAAGCGILIRLAGHASQHFPLDPDDPNPTFTLRPSVPAQLPFLDSRGNPAAGIRLELRIPEQPLLTRHLWTDSRGMLQLRGLGRGLIELTPLHARFLEAPMTHTLGPPLRRPLVLQDGFSLQGEVLDERGQPVAGAEVELRDTTVGRAFRRRLVLSDAKGRFSFGGLPEQARLRLSARLRDGTRQWISKTVQATPQGFWGLTLRSEDPALPGRRKH